MSPQDRGCKCILREHTWEFKVDILDELKSKHMHSSEAESNWNGTSVKYWEVKSTCGVDSLMAFRIWIRLAGFGLYGKAQLDMIGLAWLFQGHAFWPDQLDWRAQMRWLLITSRFFSFSFSPVYLLVAYRWITFMTS